MPPTASAPALAKVQPDRHALIAAMAARATFRVTETVVTETELGLEVQMSGEGKMIFEVLPV